MYNNINIANIRDVQIIGSEIISVADMLPFYYSVSLRFAYKADIATNIAHAKIFLFNARQEVCSWLKDFKIAFIHCSSLHNDYNYAYFT